MSKTNDELSGFTVIEKILAIIILITGGFVTYNTLNTTNLNFTFFFAIGGLSLVFIGILLLVAKTE